MLGGLKNELKTIEFLKQRFINIVINEVRIKNLFGPFN